MEQYFIDCEECENSTHVFSYDSPEFCPVCGRRADVEKRTMDVELPEEYDE